jgi:hypothetical protein
MSLSEISLVLLVVLLFVVLVTGLAMGERRLNTAPRKMRRHILLFAIGMAAWLGISGLVAGLGVLDDFNAFPPPAAGLIVSGLLAVIALVWSPMGRRLVHGLRFEELIALQAFRLPVELILLGFYFEGKIPHVMTMEGRNFDVLTAISAILVAPLVMSGSLGRKAILIWNVCGLGLLLNILSIAVLSSPGPLRHFMEEPANSLPFHWPTVWVLYCVLVALCSHLLIFRKLWIGRH